MSKTLAKKSWVGGAVFDRKRIYRYLLTRTFKCLKCESLEPCLHGLGKVIFIMCNPSTADQMVSDPTVRRCEGYARSWGYRSLIVLNIFALCSTNPEMLYIHSDPIGPENNRHIQNCTKDAGLIVCAWGIHGRLHDRGRRVLEMLRHKNPHYLELTKDGIPGHPLYLKGSLKPRPFFNN